MNDDGMDLPEILKVDPSLRGKGEVTTNARVGGTDTKAGPQFHNGRWLPKTMSPEAWEIVLADEKSKKARTDQRITEMKERLKK